jgi:hypothetical protein
MTCLPLPILRRRRAGGDILSRYAKTESGIRYTPLFVWDANTQRAVKRDLELRDYAKSEGGTPYSPLFVWDAHNQVAIK